MISKRKIVTIALSAPLAFGLGACATTPPKELVQARASFDDASKGPAGKYAPTDVYNAGKALTQANTAFEKEGDSALTKDLSYIAQRKAELADARGRTYLERERIAQAQKDGATTRDRQYNDARADLAKTRQQLDAERKSLESSRAELEAERTARLEAEEKAKNAVNDLEKIAAVKQEPRGMVITLSGSVLFASGQSTLLPAAQQKLSQVAGALKQQDASKNIVIEGHTDSQGADAYNEALSQRRATAVRDYLVSQGVAADKVMAQGFGEVRPIADNKSAEGRANNRRVEIVIPNTGNSETGMGGSPKSAE